MSTTLDMYTAWLSVTRRDCIKTATRQWLWRVDWQRRCLTCCMKVGWGWEY